MRVYKYVYSHLIIDGADIYENPDEFIAKNSVNDIKEIVVVVQTSNEFIRNILTSTIKYLQGSLPHIDMLSKAFYQGAVGETWNTLEQLIEGLQWILESYSILDGKIKLHGEQILGEWSNYAKNIIRLQEIITELMEAVEAEDQILLADLISYEITPLFKDMHDSLNNIIIGGDSLAH